MTAVATLQRPHCTYLESEVVNGWKRVSPECLLCSQFALLCFAARLVLDVRGCGSGGMVNLVSAGPQERVGVHLVQTIGTQDSLYIGHNSLMRITYEGLTTRNNWGKKTFRKAEHVRREFSSL